MSKSKLTVSWVAQIVAALIMGQTLFFKFSAAPETIHIFSQLDAEPWGRIGSGLAELLAVVLLLTPRGAALGGLATVGLMVGAIGAHFTRLGIEIRLPGAAEGDGGALFAMALVTLAAGATVTWLRRGSLPRVLPAATHA